MWAGGVELATFNSLFPCVDLLILSLIWPKNVINQNRSSLIKVSVPIMLNINIMNYQGSEVGYFGRNTMTSKVELHMCVFWGQNSV